jgi:galactonate dehydratase
MRITAIDTIQIDRFPTVVFVRIHTDAGIVGIGDTYYTTDAVRELVHRWAAPVLLGADPLAVERQWHNLFTRRAARWGGTGAEVRALSAIDVALWDIRGQAFDAPVYQLLGGLAQDRVRTYNTCAGPTYGRVHRADSDGSHPLDDLWAQWNEPARLAEELLADGIMAMKIWPFDRFALAGSGQRISDADLEAGLRPFREIRDAVGTRIDIMVEGHGYWDITTAKRIAAALEPYRPAWLEDFVLGHELDSIAELKAATTTPVVASEMLTTLTQFRMLMERRAADIVMVDPTWVGGITQTRKVVTLAEAYGLPVAMHDCTGPFTLLAGLHSSLSASNVIYQESVRAFLRTWYADVLDNPIEVRDGHFSPPTAPGLGHRLRPDLIDHFADDIYVTTSSLRS